MGEAAEHCRALGGGHGGAAPDEGAAAGLLAGEGGHLRA